MNTYKIELSGPATEQNADKVSKILNFASGLEVISTKHANSSWTFELSDGHLSDTKFKHLKFLADVMLTYFSLGGK